MDPWELVQADIHRRKSVISHVSYRLQAEHEGVMRAQADLLAAQSVLAVAQSSHADTQLELNALTSLLRSRLRRVSPISRLFPELLAMILQCWIDGVGGGDSKVRSLAPFIASSVDVTWRAVSLSTPRLWSYLGLDSDLHARPSLVRLILSRSKSTPLEVNLGKVMFGAQRSNEFLAWVFRTCTRWKSLEVDLEADDSSLQPDTNYDYITDLLSRPMPLLQNYVVHDRFENFASWGGGFPIICPSLRTMEIIGIPIWAPDQPPLLNLLDLSIYWSTSIVDSDLFNGLSLCPNLTSLSLGGSLLSAIQLPEICLPHLDSLLLNEPIIEYMQRYPNAFKMPKLRKLILPPSFPDLSSFLKSCTNVRFVDFMSDESGYLSAESLLSLRVLLHLEEIHFYYHTITDGFFLGLSVCDPPGSRSWILPRLRSFHFSMLCTIDPPEGTGLLQLLEARRTAHAAGEDVDRISAIITAKTTFMGFMDSWILDEAKKLCEAS